MSIDTTTINGGRHYIINENNKIHYLPSVTTIIGDGSDKSWLDQWYKRIGEEKAKAISKFSANRGTVMHAYCENLFLCKDKLLKDKLKYTLAYTPEWSKKEGFTEDEIKVGRDLFYNFYNDKLFERVKDIVMLEQRLHSFIGGGYAGRVDKIYKNKNNKVVIADYKTSKKPKKYEWIDDYKMQISAYYIAYWQMFNIKPSHGEIWISNEQDNNAQLFIVDENDIKKYYKEFIKLVKQYHNKYKN